MTRSWPIVQLSELLIERPPDVTVDATRSYAFAGVYSFGRGAFSSGTRDGASISYRRLTTLRTGDVVYPKLMAWEGAFAVVTPDLDGLVVSTEFPVFTPREERVLPRYLGYFLTLPSTWPALTASSTGTNVRRRRLQPDDLLAASIPLPPLQDQRRVVSQLDVAETRLASADAIRQSRLSELDALLLQRYSEIVEGTPRLPMAEVAPLVRRPVDVRPDALYPEIGIRSFGKGVFHKEPLSGLELGSKRIFTVHDGDLLFNIVFAWEGAVAIASAADHGRVGSHRFLSCLARASTVRAQFLLFHFLTPSGLSDLGQASPGGAGRNRTLGLEALARVLVPVPPLDAQDRFGQLLDLRATIARLDAANNKNTDALRASLLAQAFEAP